MMRGKSEKSGVKTIFCPLKEKLKKTPNWFSWTLGFHGEEENAVLNLNAMVNSNFKNLNAGT